MSTTQNLAKDGRPYDIVRPDVVDIDEDEVEVIQFLRPNGNRRKMVLKVGLETAKKAENMILSVEILRTGQLALYARWQGQPEEKEKLRLADNWKGENSPDVVLIRLIEQLSSEKQSK